MNELVSVVVPTYNRSHMVLDAARSVQEQTYRPIELVIVDDGSTDDTQSIVEGWIGSEEKDDFRVRYYRQANSGGNVARNLGIKHSTGEIIAFLDSDDLWHREKLAKQTQVLQATPEMGAIYCGLEHVDFETGVVSPSEPRSYPTGDLSQQLLVSDVTAPTSAYVIRRQVFDQCGCFDEQLQARQDWDMWIRISEHYQIGCVAEDLVQFRNHSGERTISDPTKELRAYERILQKYHDRLQRLPLSVRRKARASYYRRAGRVHFHQNLSHPKAVWLLLRSIACWPFTFDTYAALAGTAMPRGLRGRLHTIWNRALGGTRFAIRSH